MATINLGRIGFVNKGDYNALTAYKVNDIVKYTSGTYACKLAHTGQVPTETTYWQEWVDDNAVHKTGDETIAGSKAFSSPIKLANSGFTATLQSGTLSGDVVHTLPTTSGALVGGGDQTIAGVKTFSSSPIVPTPTTGTQAVNKEYVDSKPTLSIGAILNAYTIFDNCIVAFGGEFNRTDYPKLWAYLQANPSLVKTQAEWTTENTTNGMCGYFSNGNGTTTFRVPNLDKAFLRPDSRTVGSFQGDAIRNLYGTIGIVESQQNDPGSGVFSTSTLSSSGSSAAGGWYRGVNIVFNTSGVVPTADENRPKNIAVLPLIIAK